MRIHHLNCGTMRPIGSSEHLVCHVLLIELDDRLVLVDSGFGTQDPIDWRNRLGPAQHLLRPEYATEETAVAQVISLGLDPSDVTDVVLTHFDADHVGGLVDFPGARVHLSAAERDAAREPRTFLERSRYLPGTRAHDPVLVAHDPTQGEGWRGFAAAKPLAEVDDRMVLVGMDGHTRGHCAVAVDLGERWLLHAGDTFYHRGQVGDPDKAPRVINAMGRFSTHDMRRIRANRERLRELETDPDSDVLVFSAHDPQMLERARVANV